jgi:hypothetical protein
MPLASYAPSTLSTPAASCDAHDRVDGQRGRRPSNASGSRAPRRIRRATGWLAAGAGVAALGYAAFAGLTWYRYGQVARASADETDPLLDRFMPEYEVAERHHVAVNAPAGVTLSAASATDLQQSPIVRAIFRARELVLGATSSAAPRMGLLAQTQALGWGLLAEEPGREIVVGAVTQPWLADVVFRALPPEQFAAFREPGYVKIVWTLRADPVGAATSIFRTETRVTTTDALSRSRFRFYWSRFSPGVILIRRLMLVHLKSEAERLAKSGALSANVPVSNVPATYVH